MSESALTEDGSEAQGTKGGRTPSSVVADFGITDLRVEIIADYLFRQYRLKPDRWVKFYYGDVPHILSEWFGDHEKSLLIFTCQNSIEMSFNWPSEPTTKFTYFRKRDPHTQISVDGFRNEVIYGDFFPNILDHFQTFIHKFVDSILTTEHITQEWPDVVTEEFRRQTYQLKSALSLAISRSKGQTQLLIPSEFDNFVYPDPSQTFNRKSIHDIETLVVTWCGQVEKMLACRGCLKENDKMMPSSEIQYWQNRTKDFKQIYVQLTNPKIKMMISLLKDSSSVYYQSFKDLYRNAIQALEEAQDNSCHMIALESALNNFETISYEALIPHIGPLWHVVCLIWINSKYYNTPERMTVLLKLLCNLIIEMTESFLDPSEMFKCEMEEVIGPLKIAEEVMKIWKRQFYKCKEKIVNMFTAKQRNANRTFSWDFDPALAFARFDEVYRRLKISYTIIETNINFMKLDKIEFSGIKGNGLNNDVGAIFTEFSNTFELFSESKYNPLNTEDQEFLNCYNKFCNVMSDFDRRMATIVCKAFFDCSGLEAVYKMINIMGPLLERELILKDFYDKYPLVVLDMHTALDVSYELYQNQVEHMNKTGNMTLHKNMPPVSGAMQWADEVYHRVADHMVNFNRIEHPIKNQQIFKTVETRLAELRHLLDDISSKQYRDWLKTVEKTCKENMGKTLMLRNPDTQLLKVNLDNKLVAVLKEIKYLHEYKAEGIPEIAEKVYSLNEMLFKKYANLMLISHLYNNLITNSTPLEQPLIQGALNSIDQQLIVAITKLTWQMEDNWDYIEETLTMIQDLNSRVNKAKRNVQEMMNMFEPFTTNPLYERKEKQDNLLGLTNRADVMKKRIAALTMVNHQLQELKQQNLEQYKVLEESPAWLNYCIHLDNLVTQCMKKIVVCNLKYMIDNTDENLTCGPLFELPMELHTPNIVFIPELEPGASPSFWELFESILHDVYSQGSLINRMIPDQVKTYQNLMEENTQLIELRHKLIDHFDAGILLALRYRDSIGMSELWMNDRKEYLDMFLKYNHIIMAEEISLAGEEGVKESPPKLEHFKERIEYYEGMYKEVELMQAMNVFGKWLRVDARSFKQSLLNEIKRWSHMFKQHLIDRVINGLNELEEFIKNTMKGLENKPKEGDYDALVFAMGLLNAVRERKADTDIMFEPMKDTIEMLKIFDVDMPEKVYQQLEYLPDHWTMLKKRAMVAKQAVIPLQQNQCAKIRRKSITFDVKQHEFREMFRKCPAFFFNCKNPYMVLNKCHEEITKLEMEFKVLAQSCKVFEIIIADPKQLRQCRFELRLLKILWDYTFKVNMMFTYWAKILWSEINVDQMDTDCKKMAKELHGLDKEMRAWDVYLGLEDQLKKMITSLRSVGNLQNKAIRDRHWKELMEETKVTFKFDETTCLQDLLNLRLDKFEDEVHTIVDKAVKETSMEKTLRELNVTWANQEFLHSDHPSGVIILTAEEELIETLEDNQVQLQNMMTSRFIAHFLEEVSMWQKKLMMTDQVISIYMQVQRTWLHLESIFIGSEDIRRQLPEDTALFERIDADFREYAKQMTMTKNVVESCLNEDLAKRLEKLMDDLTICEKALFEYLETKRLAFPRFYFVSSADLLDILSNGNNPSLVCKQLTKLFDSLAKLALEKNNPKLTKSMWSKDGEWVKLAYECDLSGQVEIWLNRVLDVMRATVRLEMENSVHAYEEKPREKWLFDWPAQVALVATQIYWTSEVVQAFFKLEEGYENAMREYNKKQIHQLNNMIVILLGDLTPGDRQKIMTICTIDVHARDVVAKMVTVKADSANCFLWLSQLRHRWDNKEADCFANICDAQFRYDKEYLGNTPRLVVTPLTDRCYITLTQSLHLIMGGAPAGPAGTGKTETTKDLGRALGFMVYVFNCSEQMDYKSCGNIYKGLAQCGAWGCFDEFNRIAVEVLSVIAVQVKSIQDGIRDKKKRFNFMGTTIKLIPTVGIFITMNPGYAGRTELPENLKALFRPCAMVVPDFELICEIMLVAEGFQIARLLARKFITLYTLCKELLSKQDHYDWGLRAIKSVLVVAGALKRGDRQRPEDQVLMRALRDFNTPKIVADDMPVFMGLIGDLFPKLDVPRKRDPNFEKAIREGTIELRYQPEENFVLKVVQLQELFDVRHSVFILGNAGTGKSCIWHVLKQTNKILGKRTTAIDLDPKSVTNDELFGVISPATREWKDGLFSVVMRDLAMMTSPGPKWIVLDGDIDPMWIESLNTVMDDNKVLTLASNERITMSSEMRLLFEISNLKTATPATVSRAGILFVNPNDLGWNPYVQSWIDKRTCQSQKANLAILFDKYVNPILDTLKHRFKKITPIADIAHVQMLTFLLECMMTETTVPPDSPKELYELYFVFCCVWAFGGSLFQDQLCDHRVDFTKWWVMEFKLVKFPFGGTVFDYYIDPATKSFKPWTNIVEEFQYDPDLPLQATLVPTAETCRLRFFLDMLIPRRRPIMLVGAAGTGKSVLMGSKLKSLSLDEYMIANVPFNFYTTSHMLQNILEKPLEKKAGRNYGPPGNKKLIYFVDDMNMPEVDKYFTVQPHTLVRACIDHAHWYDRAKLTLKEVKNTMFVSCMNPTAGSFTIDARLQRHFCVFALSLPTKDALATIYTNILTQHMITANFPVMMRKYSANLVQGAIALQYKMTANFLPTAIKFHYIFNLRDLSNIFQGLLFCTRDAIKTPALLVRVYFHEAERVYRDKLVDMVDIENYDKFVQETIKKYFEDQKEDFIQAKPRIACHFAQGLGSGTYNFIQDWGQLSKLLTDALGQYNEVNAQMNLVLFEDAMSHICKINRILESPRGNALLIGVGGSGKQSLSRLAAFLSSLDVFQITLTKAYGIPDLKVDLNLLYKKAGLKGLGVVFLMSDAQVASETFLILINDLLASGEVPDIFSDEDIEEIMPVMLNECKGVGIPDTRENAWALFISKVRRNLKVVLCFSPVGATLRVRSRKFPAVTNCTCIDWFHDWPHQALVSVTLRFISDNDLLSREIRPSVAEFMAFVHESVNQASIQYLTNEKRYNYTTPKSFLELINLYQNLLNTKSDELIASIVRLENGLEKLRSTATQVDDMKSKLAAQEVELTMKNEEANELIKVVSVETEKVMTEKALADEEEAKVSEFSLEVEIKANDCHRDLIKAEPALLSAKEALNTLNKNNLTELKSFGSPPAAVVNVLSAVMVLLAPGGNVPKDRSWKAAKSTIMSRVDYFLDALINYDKDNIPHSCQTAVQPYLKDPEFDPKFIMAKSSAAAGLCSWVINIMIYYTVFCEVEPKRIALKKANNELTVAQTKLGEIKAKVGQLQKALTACQEELNSALATKKKCQDDADATAATIDLANRLVGGLASENVRWAETIRDLQLQGKSLPGDVLLISAYISYVGAFTKVYRVNMLEKQWVPFLSKLKVPIPITPDLDPLSMLVDAAQVAVWNNENLPADRMSTENATILTSCERWPLMIDPQLQGSKWIKTKYSSGLRVVRLGTPGYLETIERSVETGEVLLMENIFESVDPVLDHILGRNTINKGKAIKIGDKEINFNPKFRLILQTKLANPHYKPEMQAQTTLINFTVTRDGLEDQLLGAVVSKERPDLEKLKSDLTRQQNEFKITLKELEDNLLARLSTAEGNFLGDYALVENLETTKRTAAEIEVKAADAKITEVEINIARETYRPVAGRGSLLFFIMNELFKINPMYQFSLKAFGVVFDKAIDKADPADTEEERVECLIDCITYSVYVYTTRGLFEQDKLIFCTIMTLQILTQAKVVEPETLDFLLRFPATADTPSPVCFLTDLGYGAIKVLSEMDSFRNLDKDILGSAKRWKKFVEGEAPEKDNFPQEWKKKHPIEKLCMMRAIRPDRMSNAVTVFIEECMGYKYIENRSVEFAKSFQESGPATPMFFILSPGVDPLKDVEKHGKKMGFTMGKENFHNVSLGQGQEIVAERAIDIAAKKGHWVVLQNVHLVARWLPRLEKKIEQFSEESHINYRLFISAEPAGCPEAHIMPQGILEASIKITNEPPTGMQANLHKAFDNFTQETLECCSKELEFKAILFALCYFHAVVCQRRKFGAQGWNRVYPFNVGDLTICQNVLYNYLESNSKVPWEDLRYLFGDIMYGGHITDDWDRKLCRTYLQVYINQDLLDGDLLLAPGFPVPQDSNYQAYHLYIDEELPPESPYLYGLHPNAEIEFLSKCSTHLLRTVFEMQPRDSSAESGESMSREDKVKEILDDLVDRLPDMFNMEDIMAKVAPEFRTPFIVVAIQECERMNILTNEMRISLKELSLGLKGELTITPAMEDLSNALFINKVPERWEKRAYPSLFMMAQWFGDLLMRAKELEHWVADFQMPVSVWLGGFFNPQSFLTAIMQQMARKNEWPLDRMCIQCDVTKKNKEEFTSVPREGANVHGLFMEGARWDKQTGFIRESFLQELTPRMPVIFLKAIPVDRQDDRVVYECPVYKTKGRGPTFVWTFRLKTKTDPSKWVLAGVALLLQV